MRKVVVPDARCNPMMTETELTDTSAATSARRGAVGTTIVNRTTQTATQDNPR